MKVRILVIFLACLASALRSADVPSDSLKQTEPEIVLGMSTALSGPAMQLGQDMRRGVMTGLDRANRAGGVHGRKLRLISLDDGYEPSRTAPNMHQLIEKDNVLAVIGNVGTPTAIVAIPIAMERHILFFAAYSGAGVLRNKPPDRYVINFRASYFQEVGAVVDALIDQGGLKPDDIAVFSQRDSYGDAGFNGSMSALKRHGLKDEKSIIHVRYERNTLAVENAVASLVIAEHPPRAVIMAGAYAPSAKFIKLCVDSGINALFLNVSFVGSNPLANELAKTNARVIVTQVVPFPRDGDIRIVREYMHDLSSFDPRSLPSFGDLEGYIAARIFTTALEKIDGVPTRENIIDALESLGDFDIGLGATLTLGPRDHQANNLVWPTILKDGFFVPMKWADLADHLKTNEKRE